MFEKITNPQSLPQKESRVVSDPLYYTKKCKKWKQKEVIKYQPPEEKPQKYVVGIFIALQVK